MEFKKINEGTFECRLTSQDLQDYDMSLEDFMKDREKTMDFMHRIMELSAEELNFKPSAGVLSMQVSPLPEDGLLLTFSVSSGKDLLTQLLESILSHIDNSVKSLPLSYDGEDDYDYDDEADYDEPEDENDYEGEMPDPNESGLINMRRIMDEIKAAGRPVTDEELARRAGEETERVLALRKRQKEEAMAARVVRFDNFERFELFCRSCDPGKQIKSALLKPRNKAGYLLILEKGRASEDDFVRVLEFIEEFGEIVAEGRLCAMSAMEHSDVVIARDAVHKIRSL